MDIAGLREKFLNPPYEYGPTPFWALNNDLSPSKMESILEECKRRGISGVFMHPRTGMEVEYLSPVFWERIGFIIEKCERLGLKAWIYDEYNWPSGPVAGKLLTEHPEYIQKYLDYVWVKDPVPGRAAEHPGKAIAAFLTGSRIENVTSEIKDGRLIIPDGISGGLLLFYSDDVTDRMFVTSNAPWCRYGIGYLDLMNPSAVQAFMDMTHREYERRFSRYFGKTIPGVFTDEPQNYRGFPWTENFAERFHEQKGCDIIERLYQLVMDSGEFERTRCDFYEVAESLTAQAFYEPIAEWCGERGLVLTGHLGMEEKLSELCSNHGGIYRAYSAMQIPGIDALGDGNGFTGRLGNMESPNFAPKAASSAAHALSKKRVLCEAGGGCGWQTTLLRLKSQLDWLFAAGVNFINPHHLLSSLKGLRKRDFPATHYVQEPWWNYYDLHAGYIRRMSFLLSQGVHSADILLYFPVENLRAIHRGRTSLNRESSSFIRAFDATGTALLRHQRDFDYLFPEAILQGKVKVKKDKLVMGDESFGVLVLPRTDIVCGTALELFEEYISNGGRAVALGPLPRKSERGVDITSRMVKLFRSRVSSERVAHVPEYEAGKEDLLIEALNQLHAPDFEAQGILARDLIYTHREIDGTDIYFVANLSGHEGRMSLVFRSDKSGLELWRPLTRDPSRPADAAPVLFDVKKKGFLRTEYRFNPYESVVFAVSDKIKSLPFRGADFDLLETSAEKLRGYGEGSEAHVKTESGTVKLESGPGPEAIEFQDCWDFRPESANTWVLEPWKVKADYPKPLPLSKIKDEYYFSRRTRGLIYLGRVLVPILNLVARPDKKYRHERYTSFGNIEQLTAAAGKILGIDLSRMGLYQSFDTLLRVSEYLDARTMFRVFPPAGRVYEASVSFEAQYIPDDLELVYEDLGEKVELWINGSKISREPERVFVWDDCNVGLPVADLIKPGRNTLKVRTRQLDWPCMSPNLHGLEFFALRGSFEVRMNRMARPCFEGRVADDWREEGYPNYSGFAAYSQSIEIPARYLKYYLVLECDTVHETLELEVNGASAGVCLGPPWRLPISGHVREGRNEFVLRVGNTAANLLGKPRASGLIGRVRIRAYNLFEYPGGAQ